MKKRILSIILTACLAMGLMPTAVFASENVAGILCEHHPEHTTECGYEAAIEGHACTHEHDDECGYAEGQACTHEHDDECGENGESCTHEHDESCGYIEEQACTHEHDDECGYAEASEGSPCTFTCDICENEETTQKNEEETTQENTLSDAVLAVQELIDTIPDAVNITEDNYEDIADLLAEIDTLKEELTTEEIEILDFTKYDTAVDKIMEFISQEVTEESALMVASNCTCLIKCKEKNNDCPACKSSIDGCAGRPKFVDYQGESIVNADGLHSIMSWPASQRDYYYYALDWQIRNDNDALDVLATVPSDADVIIDLNGKTLDGNNKGTIFEVAGKLTIIDTVGTGQIIKASNGAFHILEGGSVILKGVTIRNCVGSGAVTVESGGSLDITDVTMKNNKILDTNGDYKDDDIKQYTRNITMKGNSVISLGGSDTYIGCCGEEGCRCSGDSIYLKKTNDSEETELIPTLYANSGEITGNVYNEGKILYRNVDYGPGTNIRGTVNNHGTIDAHKGNKNVPYGAKFYSIVENNGTIIGGRFHNTVKNKGTISGGVFYYDSSITNNGTISGGNYTATIFNHDGGTISGGSFSNYAALEKNVFNITGTISGGEFNLSTENNSTISGGTFNSQVKNVGDITNNDGEVINDAGEISGGTFNGYVDNRGVISGGTFYGTVDNSKGTIQDSAYVPVYFVINTNKVIDTLKVLRGQGVPSSSIPQFRPQQYGYDEFGGWHYEGDKFTGGGKFTADENYIYAELSNLITYDISYNLHGGTATNPTTYNEETETFTLENPTKTGYDFTGWSGTKLDGSNNMTVTIEQGSTGDRVFTANYTPKSNFTINFNTNGGNSIPSKQNVKWTDRVLDKVKTPNKSRYRFIGWVCNGITVNEYTTYSQLVANDTTSSITLIAKWSSISGGSSGGGSSSSTGSSGGGLIKKDPIKPPKPTETSTVGTIENTSLKTEATTEATNKAAAGSAKNDATVNLVTTAGTKVSGDNFKEPVIFSIPANTNGVKNVNNLTLARFNTETGKLEIIGGSYNAETKSVKGYVDKAGDYFVVEKQGLLSMTLQVGNTDVTLNTGNKKLDATPILYQNRTMVPLRFISESLGANVNWEDATKTVDVSLGDKKLTMTIGQEIDGFGVSPIISNNRTMVPLRYISEEFGANVLWVPSTQKISIAGSNINRLFVD